MIEQTCSQCHGSGKERRGSVVAPVDPEFDFHQGFQTMGSPDEVKARYAEKAKRLMLLIADGDKVEVSGGYVHTVLDVGMYDGWPFWKPTPAALCTGPLGVGDWAFYYNINAVQKQGTSTWIR